MVRWGSAVTGGNASTGDSTGPEIMVESKEGDTMEQQIEREIDSNDGSSPDDEGKDEDESPKDLSDGERGELRLEV